MDTMNWLPKNHEDLYDHVNQMWSYIKEPANRTRMGLDGKVSRWLNKDFARVLRDFTKVFEEWKKKAVRTPALT
ncbi:MAG: hypothetical protein LBI60_01370, partial [Bacteroidales bacterium]|nr:hypothetical protein [Bacteroidales bacterium]